MNYSHRIFLYGPVGLFATLMLATMGNWWFASHAFAKRLDAANGHDIAPGVHFSFAQKTMAGFPFRIDCELDGLRISVQTSHGPAIWTAEHFALHSLTYGQAQYVFEAAGKQHIEWHRDSGELHSYDFLPGDLRASAIANDKGLARFDLDLIDDDSTDVSAAHVQLHLRKNPTTDGLDVAFSADDVRMAPDLSPAFGSNIKRVAFDGLVSPGSSFDKLLAGEANWRDAVQNWHARDGGMLINNLELNWGKFNTTGKGALAVDVLHRPLGAVHLQISGWQRLRQQLSANSQNQTRGLAAGLTTFARGAPHDADEQTVTVVLKDGVLFVGSAPADLLSPLY